LAATKKKSNMNKTQNPSYKKNEIDDLFYEIYGFYPTIEGQSYELLVGAVLKILLGVKIIHDESLKGNYDSNSYQIDVSLYSYEYGDVMVEAKDYSKREGKVSRPNIDKIVGSLVELNFDEGYFFSSTGYTKDAERKANATEINPLTKRINLFHLRNSNSDDEKNRLKKIQIDIQIPEINQENVKVDIKADMPEEAKISGKSECLFELFENVISFKGTFKNSAGEEVGGYNFLKKLNENVYEEGLKSENLVYERVWDLDDGELTIKGKIYSIEMVRVKIPLKKITVPVIAQSTGIPKILVRSDDNSLNKLITDNQLKGITFMENGEILFNGANP
jgi:hypothetical protein